MVDEEIYFCPYTNIPCYKWDCPDCEVQTDFILGLEEEENKKAMVELKRTETFIEHDLVVNGKKIGYVELCPERKEIARLVIFEPYQNKGYGTEVVKKLIDEGYNSLWVRSDNPRAIHVYTKCGFRKADTCMYEMRMEVQE